MIVVLKSTLAILAVFVALMGILGYVQTRREAEAFASAEADDALNWAAVGGRHSTVGAYAQFGTKPINHRFRTGAYDSVDPNVVEVYASYLRRKIDSPFGRRALQTVRGAGYKLAPDGG